MDNGDTEDASPIPVNMDTLLVEAYIAQTGKLLIVVPTQKDKYDFVKIPKEYQCSPRLYRCAVALSALFQFKLSLLKLFIC